MDRYNVIHLHFRLIIDKILKCNKQVNKKTYIVYVNGIELSEDTKLQKYIDETSPFLCPRKKFISI